MSLQHRLDVRLERTLLTWKLDFYPHTPSNPDIPPTRAGIDFTKELVLIVLVAKFDNSGFISKFRDSQGKVQRPAQATLGQYEEMVMRQLHTDGVIVCEDAHKFLEEAFEWANSSSAKGKHDKSGQYDLKKSTTSRKQVSSIPQGNSV
jgi:hypothetical protein